MKLQVKKILFIVYFCKYPSCYIQRILIIRISKVYSKEV